MGFNPQPIMATWTPKTIPLYEQAANLAPFLANSVTPANMRWRFGSFVANAYAFASH